MSSVALQDAADPVGLAEVQAVGDALARISGGLVAEAVPLGEVGVWWEAIQRVVRLAGSLETIVARRVAESRGWERAGYRSPAEQLAASGGTSVPQARALLEASEQVAELPATDSAVRAGVLSAAQTVAVAGAAAANPAAEEALLAKAGGSSLAELRQEALRVKAAADADPDATYRRIHTRRRPWWHTDAEGAFCLNARGTVDDGARITAALQPLIDDLFVGARRRGEPEPREAYALTSPTSGAGLPSPSRSPWPGHHRPARSKAAPDSASRSTTPTTGPAPA